MQSYLISFKKSKVLNFLDLPHFLSSFKNQLQKYQTPPGHTANWNRIFFFSIFVFWITWWPDFVSFHAGWFWYMIG